MKRLSVLTVFSFFFSIGIVQAAPGDSIWILNPDTVGRQYNSYSVCDTNRNATGDTGCLPPSETHCDTGTTGAPDTQYIDYNYTMQNGYAGFKIDWDAGGSRYVVAGFDSLVIYHKGPLTGETVTINFGASVTCGQPTVFTKLGTFSGSSSWTREAFSLKSLPNDSGLYEMQVLINDSINPTASGNFKLGHMVFIKNIIKDQASSPALLTPADSALAQPLQVTLTWAKVPIATSYWVQVATSADFIGQTFSGDSILYYSNTVFSQSGLTSTSVTVSSGLLAGQPYYWQVLAANVNGMSPWATAWSFFTTTDPIGNSSSIPILVSPANKAAGQPLSVKLAWDSVKVATSYNVQVSTDAAFGSTVFSQTGIAATSVTVPDLSGSMTYYWRVAAADKSGTSAWSNPEVFSTTTSSSSKKNCGCGSGTGLALIPPIWLKARSSRRKKRQKTADV